MLFFPATSMRKPGLRRASLTLVAGPGFAPGPQGYEPCEVLLLHPAIDNIVSYNSEFFKYTRVLRNSGARIVLA